METFISDLKASVAEAKEMPEGKGTMVALYGTCFLWSSPYDVLLRSRSFVIADFFSSSFVGRWVYRPWKFERCRTDDR